MNAATRVIGIVLPLVGCSASPPPARPQIPTVAFLAAKLAPGCLLPDPALLRSGSAVASKVILNVTVGADGRPFKSVVAVSSGNEAIDAGFVDAALKCGFSIAKSGDRPVPDSVTVSYAWSATQGFAGPLRCFLPDYPRAALRAGETAIVRIQFRLAATSSSIETRVSSSQPSASLVAYATAAVRECLAHPEARRDMLSDKWYELPFNFQIE